MPGPPGPQGPPGGMPATAPGDEKIEAGRKGDQGEKGIRGEAGMMAPPAPKGEPVSELLCAFCHNYFGIMSVVGKIPVILC